VQEVRLWLKTATSLDAQILVKFNALSAKLAQSISRQQPSLNAIDKKSDVSTNH